MSPASKYCKVVFADDRIFPECVERMVTVAEADPSVGLVGAYGIEGSRVVWTGLPYPDTVVSGREVCRRLFLEGLYVLGTATSVLYRADLVRSHDPFFDASDMHSDMETCIILLKNCDFGFVHQVLTVTRVREGSRITLSRRVNTLAASKLNQLVTHGRDFLSPEEFAGCLDRACLSITGTWREASYADETGLFGNITRSTAISRRGLQSGSVSEDGDSPDRRGGTESQRQYPATLKSEI